MTPPSPPKKKKKENFFKDFNEIFKTPKVKLILFYKIEFSYIYVLGISFSKHTVIIEI